MASKIFNPYAKKPSKGGTTKNNNAVAPKSQSSTALNNLLEEIQPKLRPFQREAFDFATKGTFYTRQFHEVQKPKLLSSGSRRASSSKSRTETHQTSTTTIETSLDRSCLGKGRILLADEMGLGKTVSALAIMAYYQEEWPLLILCPASLRYTWPGEIEKFLPSIPPSAIHVAKGFQDVSFFQKKKSEVRIVVLTYSLFQERSAIQQTLNSDEYRNFFRCIIADESHNLKSRSSQRAKFIIPLLKRSKRLLLLSGTPALARPEELWTQVSSLAPALFPKNFTQFANRYCDPKQKHFGRGRVMMDYSGASNQAELHSRLKNIMVRRLKVDVLSELPPKQRSVIPVTIPLESSAGKDCRNIMEELKATRASVADLVGEEAQGADFQARSLLMQAYQATGTAKAPAVRDYLIDWLEGTSHDSKILVFCHHKAVMELLHEALLRHGRSNRYSHIRIDGTVPTDTRASLVRKFQTSSHYRVGILSMTAAGVGLTLTAASTVLFAELHWTPGVLVQCEDRAHRIGQSHDSVQVLYMLAKESHSVDSMLWQMLGRKIDTLNKVVDGGNEDKPYLHAAKEQSGQPISSGAPRRSGQEELTAFFAENTPHGSVSKPKVPVKGSLDFFFKKASEAKLSQDSSSSHSVSTSSVVNSHKHSSLGHSNPSFTNKPPTIRWDCPICTLSNSKEKNRIGWYACAACEQPYDPSHEMTSSETIETGNYADNSTPAMTSGRKRTIGSSSVTPASNTSKKRAHSEEPCPRSPEVIILDSPDRKPSPRRIFSKNDEPPADRSNTDDIIILEDSDDGESVTAPQTSKFERQKAGVNIQSNVRKAATSSMDKLQFSVSPHSERITIHDENGLSTKINVALEDVLSAETSDSLSEARVQKQSSVAISQIPIAFNEKGMYEVYSKLNSTNPGLVQDSEFLSEFKRFVHSYLRLRSVERKAVQESGRSFGHSGLAMAVARLLLPSSTQSSSTERYVGGAKERARERQEIGTATEMDQLVLNGKACAWCGSTLNSHQIRGEATYCTQSCAEEGRLRRNGFSGANIRAAAFALDGGVCSMCGINAHLLFEQIQSLAPTERLNKLLTANWVMPKSTSAYNNLLNDPKEGNFWQVDHIQTVAEGGGGCGMENLRTLCVPCHAKETEKLHGRLKLKSKSDQEESGMTQMDIRSAFSAANR